MSKNDLKVVLEVEKESSSVIDQNAMFYRYRIGDFKLWFSQDNDSGNIFSVGLREEGKELEDFEVNVYCNEEGRKEKHVGYYPNEFKVRPRSYPMTTDEAQAFMVKMKKACAVLDTVEDFFKNSKHYERYAQAHGLESKADIEDELISRKALMEDIEAYFGCSRNGIDEDCRKVWSIIANYNLQDGDLVSREGLLSAVLDEFGCDLAYYGRDLQFFQDAIVGIPAASKGKVDELIADASQRSVQQGDEKKSPKLEETKLM